MQKAGEPENDAGFLKVIVVAVHLASKTFIIHTPLSLEQWSQFSGNIVWFHCLIVTINYAH